MVIKRVWIEEGCIACSVSADTCPEVFEIPAGSDVAVVKPGVDLARHEDKIREAAESCPVSVIRYEEA